MRFRTKFRITLFALYLVIICCISDNNFIDPFDSQPKILIKDGHIVFETARNKNITFRSSGGGRITVDGQDLTRIAELAKTANLEGGTVSNSQLNEVQNSLEQLRTQFSSLSNAINELRSLQTALNDSNNKINQILGTGSNALQTNTVRRYLRKIPRLETSLQRLTQLLETNECQSNPCRNGGTCTDTYDGFICNCPPNWEGVNCDTDVNECSRFIGTELGCQNGATCVNTPGSYSCTCTPNWYGIHCTEQHDDCSSASNDALCGQGTCVNQQRSIANLPNYRCICNQGWTSSGHNPACVVDIDECTERQPHCSVSPPVTCINLPGTFYCGPCPPGYTGNGYYCHDINECEINNGGCSQSPRVQCTNTIGSRICGACPPGYNGNGFNCDFTGVCRVNNGGCHPSAQCFENMAISSAFRECRCPTGFIGSGIGPNGCVPQSGTTCSNNPCLHGSCIPNGDSFTCICFIGFTGSLCESEMNECQSNPCLNGGTCTDQQNGFLCVCTAQWQGSTCSEPRQSCGGTLNTEVGTISFPTDPNSVYPHRMNCAWLIITIPGKVLNVTFSSFNVEQTTDCSYDFLQIHDGPNAAAHNLGRFCGTTLPRGGNFVTTHHQLYLWFRSDQSVAHDGFNLFWNTTDPVCGGELDIRDYGSFNSPGYPGNYPHNRDCYWMVRVPLGKRIQFHFATLQIETHSDCNYDYLEVFDGQRESDPLLGKFCNVTTPAPLTASGSQSLIHFHSDDTMTDHGFHITYASIPGIPGCGGALTSERGTFTSPNFPDRYDNNIECDWTIRVHPNDRIQIQFSVFDLEDHSKCGFDYLEIRDGDNSESPLLNRLCGRDMPPNIVSSGNRVWIKFRADASFSGQGFRAQYNTVCGGLFTDMEGEIKSPFFPDPYPSDRKCQYHIVLPEGNLVQISFLHFDVEGSIDCNYDYLQVRESHENGTDVGKFCGQTPPDTITSKYNELWLEFKTDGSVSNHGFHANYTNVEVGCGGVLSTNHGIITNENNNRNGRRCSWLIRADPGFVIQLTFTVFSVEFYRNCGRSYVEVRDSNYALIGKYCGSNRLPPILTSTGSQLFVSFKSGSNSREGFAAAYSFLDASTSCGGNYFTDSGVIRSPGYPNRNYPALRDCVWVLEVANGRQIVLNVTSFNLEGSTSCQFDSLEIRNGREERSPLIGKFCGTTIPKTITSHGHVLYLRFKADRSLSTKGFEILYDSGTTGCGGTLSSQTGSIESPGYPEPYGHNAECVWLISVSRGSTLILNLVDVDIEAHSTCQFDYLEIFDGNSDRSKSLGKFCNNRLATHYIKSKGSTLFLKFRTDVSESGRGFRLSYQINCTNTISGYRGVIESPNFPGFYNHNSNCTWQISAPKGNNITIAFSQLVIEPDLNCQFDYLQVSKFDFETNNSTEVAKFCGNYSQVPAPFNLSSSDAIIRFISDSSVAHIGFRLEWVAVGCGGDFINKNSGEFSSPNYPNGYPHSTECLWHIRVPVGSSIQLILNDFDIEADIGCSFDFLKVFGGPDDTAPLLLTQCHKLQDPKTISSMGQSMTVKFRSDASVRGKGFRASFVAIGGSCSGLFTTETGTITSPKYPSNYDSNDDCDYTIDVKGLHDIQLTFEDFGIPFTPNCTESYLSIFDGPTADDPLLLRHCGNELPTPNIIRSTGSKVFMRMKANGRSVGKGFKISYITMCGGRKVLNTNEVGELTSPNYPVHSIVNQECNWILIASQPEEHITLTFTHMDIHNIDDCEHHYVEVRDGDSGGTTDSGPSPLIGKYCGDRIPVPITSQGNSLFIKNIMGIFRATFATSTSFCGGEFTAQEGYFMSPNYPNSYPLETECIWIIRSAPGNRVTFNFISFQIEANDYCNTDYVEMREQSSSGPLLGRYCGLSAPTLNFTSTNILWVKFRSDQSGTAQGFQAYYALEHGIDLIGPSGQIASPGYPHDIRPQESMFTWTITVPPNRYARITFTELALQAPNGECTSYIAILDGVGESAPELGRYCGFTLPDPVAGYSNTMTVTLVTTFGYPGKFFLNWNSVNYTEVAAIRNRRVLALSNTTFDINLNKTSTYVLTSPGYPTGYEPNINYNWTFRTSQSFHFKVNITDMNTEGNNQRCYYDYIKLMVPRRRDSSVWRVNQTVCGRFTGELELPAFHIMRINFLTDYWVNKTGFNLTVIPVCGGTLYASYGYLSTDDVLNAVKCDWVIVVREGRTIQITFESMNIADNNNCQFSYIQLRNGHRKTSPSLGGGRYCGRNIPIIPESSSNRIRVEFFARRDLHADFRLRYDEVSIGCGGQLELSETNRSLDIMSPNYPQLPPHNVECDWVIRSPMNTNIRFDFVFSQTPSRSCNKSDEFVEIRDGGTEVSTQIDKYCVPPRYSNSIRSTGNYMFVRFVTSNAQNLQIFKANIKISDCGATYYVPRYQELQLPNYPNNYTDNTECVYYLKSYFSYDYFEVNITSMDIIADPDCSSGDYVEFREESATGDLIGRYCGSADENNTISLRSKGSVIYIIFKSDTSQTGKGIKLGVQSHWNGCGNDIENAMAKGLITSPNFPNPMSEFVRCFWTVMAPAGRSIKLKFLNYNLKVDPRNSTKCSDSLKVYSGDRSSTQIKLNCGTVRPEPIQLKSHISSLMFVSSGLGHFEGFKLEYSADEEEVCGGILSESTGSISSYRFGESNFTEPIDCVWDLDIPTDSSNHTVAFIFDVFEIPESDRCLNSSLRLAYYNHRYRYFYQFGNKFCGNLTANGKKLEFFAPNKIYANLAQPRLFLTTNYTNGYRGIRGKYYIQECGGYFYSPEGEYSSPNYPNNYPIESYCVWGFTFDWGSKVRITFTEFNLDNDCEKDYVQLSQGYWSDSPKSDKFCGSTAPPVFESTARKIRIDFKGTAVSNSQNPRRFKMSVTRVEHGCGGLILHPIGTLESIKYGADKYENNMECVWSIQMPVGFHINFTFTDRFDIEQTDDCNNDYILFQERLNPDDDQSMTTIAKYCGRETPKPFKSKTNRVEVIFHTNDNINGDGFRLKYQIACGEVYTEPTGVILSPNYPNNYKNNIRCEYLILRDPRDVIRLEFDNFDVESHQTCKWDSINIYLGNNTSVQHQGPYCGQQKPPVTLSAGALLITFITDVSVTRKGFKASYSISSCGGNLTDPSGEIASPAYFPPPVSSGFVPISYRDQNYVNSVECVWFVTIAQNRVIEAKFSSLALKNCYQCYCESVTIRDGINSSSPLIGKYCNNRDNRDVGLVVKSSGNKLWVRFRSDQPSSVGFRLIYRTTLGEAQGCGGVFNNISEGTFQSPDADNDGNYDTDLNCWYHFIVPEEKVVKITFQKMDIEESPSNTTKCAFDYIEIRDGLSHKASLIDRYCGTTLPSVIIGSTNKLVLQFYSDSTGVKTGFKAKFEAIDKICGGSLNVTNITQTIQSINYPNGYPTSLRCKWHFLYESSLRFYYKDFFLKFVDLDVNCNNNDYIEFNADSYSISRIAPYRMCGTRAPPTISSKNGLWMTFVTNANPASNHKGFKLDYKISGCNQTYNEDSGIIVNTYYPDYSYSKCQFNITARVGYTIALYFNDFGFYNGESASGCPRTNMTIEDANDVKTLCGNTIPDPIFSNGNRLSVTIRNSWGAKYFISYSTTNAGRGCGGNLTAFNGTFTSPLYPQPYNQSTECKWFVHSFGLHTLTLRFTQLSLSSTIGCQSNYVEVYEGMSDLPSNRVIRLCGDDNPAPYRSRGNLLLVKLVTNGNNTGPGFRAQYNFNSQELNSTKVIMTSNLRPHITADGSVYFPSDGIMFRRDD